VLIFNSECTDGKLTFSGHTLSDYTQTFEMILAATSIYDCVQSCYELQCTRLAFTHFPRSACLLHFNAQETPLEKLCQGNESLRSNWEFQVLLHHK
jgi:hypothetical protein